MILRPQPGLCRGTQYFSETGKGSSRSGFITQLQPAVTVSSYHTVTCGGGLCVHNTLKSGGAAFEKLQPKDHLTSLALCLSSSHCENVCVCLVLQAFVSLGRRWGYIEFMGSESVRQCQYQCYRVNPCRYRCILSSCACLLTSHSS